MGLYGRLYTIQVLDSSFYIFIMYNMQPLYASHGKSSGNKEIKKKRELWRILLMITSLTITKCIISLC